MKLETTNYLEMKHYIQIVEKKNHDLNRKLEIMMSDNMQFSVSSQDQKKAASFMASELKFENEKLS